MSVASTSSGKHLEEADLLSDIEDMIRQNDNLVCAMRVWCDAVDLSIEIFQPVLVKDITDRYADKEKAAQCINNLLTSFRCVRW
jgi:hypothetical protein